MGDSDVIMEDATAANGASPQVNGTASGSSKINAQTWVFVVANGTQVRD